MSKAVLFSGQGAQKVGMGKALHETSALVRDLYAEADEVLGWSLSRLTFEGPEEELTKTSVCQPALYVVGYAAYRLLGEAGKLNEVELAAGLSLGELTALAAAQSFSFADGLRVVAERGRLMQAACDTSDGAMASLIGGEEEQVRALCRDHDVDLANLNCPGQLVISGERNKVEAAAAAAKENGNFRMVVPLKVAGAYHSRLMSPAKEAFSMYLQEVPVAEPQLTVLSNTTGQPVRRPQEIRDALSAQVVSSVLWEACMREAAACGCVEFYECGPGGVLAGLARRTDRMWTVKPVSDPEELAKA